MLPFQHVYADLLKQSQSLNIEQFPSMKPDNALKAKTKLVVCHADVVYVVVDLWYVMLMLVQIRRVVDEADIVDEGQIELGREVSTSCTQTYSQRWRAGGLAMQMS